MPASNTAPFDTWIIKLGGSPLSATLMDALYSAEVDSSLEVPDMATLRFRDPQISIVDDSVFDLGKALEIAPTPPPGEPSPTVIFTGEIVALEPNFEDGNNASFTVRAYDKRHRLTRETKTRVFTDVTDSDIATQLIRGSGLTANVTATNQVRKAVFQQNQTDLEFLSLLARRNGYEIWTEGATLYFGEPTTPSEPILSWGETLRSFRTRLSGAGQVDEVFVRGWHDVQKMGITGHASSSTSHPQIGYGKSGGAAAQSGFSRAKHIDVQHVVREQEEADKIAQSLLNDINNDFIEAEGVAFGNAKVLAGQKVRIDKVGQRFAGTYHVTSATHVWEKSGYEVHFRVSGARPKLMSDLVAPVASGIAAASASSGYPAAAVGLVTNNVDPDNMGRVKLKFPWFYDQAESFWSRVVTLGAGNNRGMFWLPEVNDEVLVVFMNGDMNTAVVVGGLYNSQDKPPLPSSEAVKGGKVVERIVKTTAGHVIQLTDESGSESISIRSHNNNVSMKMDAKDNKMTHEAQSDMTIESKSAKVTVKAGGDIIIESKANVSVKAAQNVNIEGSTQVNIKGNAGVKVESSGMLELKGSMVKIN